MKKFIKVYFLLVCLAVGLCCSSVQAVESASAALLFKIARTIIFLLKIFLNLF